MKTIDFIYRIFEKRGAEFVYLEDDFTEFILYDRQWFVKIDPLHQFGEVSCSVFDSDQRNKEDIDIDSMHSVINQINEDASKACFYEQPGDDIQCRLTFNYNSLPELEFRVINSMHQIMIFGEAFLNIACASLIDAHLDPLFNVEQIRKARYNHLKEYLECNILYVHGFRSTGNGGTANRLREYLPHCKVISPDLPVDAGEAVVLLKKIVENEMIDVVVGASMGGMLAQKLRGVPKILVNPSFFVSETFKKNMGTVKYFKERADGATEFEITPEVVKSYINLERGQFSRISPKEIAMTVGVFGTRDKTVNCKSDFEEHYEIVELFDGEHRLDERGLKNVVIPAIASLYRNTQITWK